MPLVDRDELGAFLFGFPVVGKVVVAVGDRLVGNLECRGAHAVEHQGNRAGGVGLDGEPRQVIHDFDLRHVGGGIRGIDGHGRLNHGLGLGFPTARGLQPVLQIAHAREVLVESVAIARRHAALEFTGLAGHGVQNTATVVELTELGFYLLGGTLEKELLENLGGLVLGRDRDAGAGP